MALRRARDRGSGSPSCSARPLCSRLAAALAFLPARRAAPALRAAGLVALLLLYGTAVTEHDPGAAAAARAGPARAGRPPGCGCRGWAAREARRRRRVVLALGVLSLPVAAALDSDRPWWDYRAWNWFGNGKVDHASTGTTATARSTGRATGTTLLNVKSDRPHYWKAETLDGFDGLRWMRTRHERHDARQLRACRTTREPRATLGLLRVEPATGTSASASPCARCRRLFVVGAGTTYGSTAPAHVSSATTARRADRPTTGSRGRHATRCAPTRPNPTRRQMRGAPERYLPTSLLQYTTIALPRRASPRSTAGPARSRASRRATRESIVPAARQRPDDRRPRADALLRARPTRRMYGIALRAHRRRADHVRRGEARRALPPATTSRYSEHAAQRTSTRSTRFLFDDKLGYCQQFSGAMALMLRMAGHPGARGGRLLARLATTATRGEYRVRDLDAHSWVEVYFTGIGWVPFDPTPAALAGASRSRADAAPRAPRGRRRRGQRLARRAPPRRARERRRRRLGAGAGGRRAGLAAAARCCSSLALAPG